MILGSLLTGPEPTIREQIVQILCQEWPLTLKRLYLHLAKLRQGRVSYQAAHKAVRWLEGQGVVLRTAAGYQLSLTWVQQIRQLCERLATGYAASRLPPAEIIENRSPAATLQFSSCADAAQFIREFLQRLGERTRSRAPAVAYVTSLAWLWPLPWKPGLYACCTSDREDDHAIKASIEQGRHCRVALGVPSSRDAELLVAEDFVVQVYLPAALRTNLEHGYPLNTDQQILLVVSWNPQAADRLRTETLGNWHDNRMLRAQRGSTS